MKKFVTALQFLTRIPAGGSHEVTPETFGGSVKFFTLVGAVIGAILAGFCYLADPYLPANTLAALIILLEIAITGALHCDGLMDTFDGVLSGRSRDRMLEIMKDSRVGAHGVTVFVALMLLKWSLLTDLAASLPLAVLFIMPVLGRLAMVIAIICFPYARPEGLGKAFALFAGRPALYFAAGVAAFFVAPWGKAAQLSLVAAAAFAWLAGRYFTSVLGGLTGDVYGAITELAEILVLLVALLAWELALPW
jgi:adenosylcobinamide-GDP ribazoletransferase